MGTNQSVEVQLPQSEPMPNIVSSSHDDIHATLPRHSGSRRSTHHESDVVEDSSVTQKKIPYVCTKWNVEGQPIGESVGLLAGFLGEIASNFNNFPIMYETWKKVPKDYKDNVYKETIKAKFDVNDQEHKKYILVSLGKKWRDTQCRLFHKNYNSEIFVEENCRMHPTEIDLDHWRLFEISDKNAANREKLLIPHTLGSKTLARKRDKLEVQYGQRYSRGDMYPITHKKKDGSFVNEDAREKYEQLHNEIQDTSSENEAFLKVYGSSSDAATIAQLQSKVETLKARVGEVDILEEQLAFLMQVVKGNQAADLESPRDLRRSYESSHVPNDNGGSSQGTI
ncbi:putative transposase, Ptta/En/Spm, plant [Sesbania bispinosa]|nr:putative transposase, Ptta/En/Spm, plant [Sesbania bispinosa]